MATSWPNSDVSVRTNPAIRRRALSQKHAACLPIPRQNTAFHRAHHSTHRSANGHRSRLGTEHGRLLQRMPWPKPIEKNDLMGRSVEWGGQVDGAGVSVAGRQWSGLSMERVVNGAGCQWSGLLEDAGGIPACSRCVERQRHHRLVSPNLSIPEGCQQGCLLDTRRSEFLLGSHSS